MDREDDNPQLKPYGNQAEVFWRMTNVCQAAFALQQSLQDDEMAELTEELGEPFLDLVVALSLLYEGCEVEFKEGLLDS